MKTVIECQQLQYNELHQPVSFVIKEKTITCIVGPLRSGKSSLMLTLAGINAPTAGKTTIFGLNPNTIKKGEWLELRRRVGYVLPNSSLVSHLSGINNVALPINYHQLEKPGDAEQVAVDMLTWLGCEADYNSLPSSLCEHDKRLINIARALVLSPSVLCIDEAFAQLDVLKKKEFIHHYEKICQERDITLLLATHDLNAARECGDQFIFMAGEDVLWFDNWEDLQASDNQYLIQYREGIA